MLDVLLVAAALRVEPTPTPLGEPETAAVLRDAYHAVAGDFPPRPLLSSATTHILFETGRSLAGPRPMVTSVRHKPRGDRRAERPLLPRRRAPPRGLRRLHRRGESLLANRPPLQLCRARVLRWAAGGSGGAAVSLRVPPHADPRLPRGAAGASWRGRARRCRCSERLARHQKQLSNRGVAVVWGAIARQPRRAPTEGVPS